MHSKDLVERQLLPYGERLYIFILISSSDDAGNIKPVDYSVVNKLNFLVP